MGKEFSSTTLIDLGLESPRVLRGSLVDTIDTDEPAPDTFIQHGTSRTNPKTVESTAAMRVSIPETKPLDEYKDPLTYELMYQRYSGIYSAADRDLLCEPCGSPQWEAARQKAKRSITKEFLHKPGLPSEFMNFLDIDVVETRELLDGIYFSIPEDVDRDNHVNNFDQRCRLIKQHILQTHEDPDIEEQLQTKIDIWREDLLLRAQIMAGDSPPDSQLTQQRRTYLDLLVENPESPRHELIHKIGNTLLHATPTEKAAFLDEAKRTNPQTEHALGALSLLVGYLEEYHPGE